jgi:hypothetical protein
MNDEYDVWNPLANLLADLIEKYASELDLDNFTSEKNSHLTDADSVKSIEINKKV